MPTPPTRPRQTPDDPNPDPTRTQDTPGQERFGRTEPPTARDDDETRFTAPDPETAPESGTPDTDDHEDTDEDTDGTPVLA